MSTVKIVCTILSTSRGIDIMSKILSTLPIYIILPYDHNTYAIYNRKLEQYLTVYRNLVDAEKDLKLVNCSPNKNK